MILAAFCYGSKFFNVTVSQSYLCHNLMVQITSVWPGGGDAYGKTEEEINEATDWLVMYTFISSVVNYSISCMTIVRHLLVMITTPAQSRVVIIGTVAES